MAEKKWKGAGGAGRMAKQEISGGAENPMEQCCRSRRRPGLRLAVLGQKAAAMNTRRLEGSDRDRRA